MKRKICVVTGTRAEYGLLYPVMKAIQSHSELVLSVIATGMHLVPEFGNTVDEFLNDNIKIDARVPMYVSGDSGASSAMSIGLGILGLVQAFEQIKPSIVIVLGDRVEPLAAAIASVYMNIPLAHIHGGDTSNGLDEYARHAITKLSNIHFPATKESARRIISMGENPQNVHIVGPLGIYAMQETDYIPRERIFNSFNMDVNKPFVLVIQHPVTTQVEEAANQIKETLDAIVELGEQTILVYPNSDAGGRSIINVIGEYEKYSNIKTVKNLSYLNFLSLMKNSDVIVGNSSSAIVEAPLFGIPAVNIGLRQQGRERGANIIDVQHKAKEITTAIREVLGNKELKKELFQNVNPFSVDFNGAEKMVEILKVVPLDSKLLQKKIMY